MSVNNGAGLNGAASMRLSQLRGQRHKKKQPDDLLIHRLDYIAQVLIPFFDALVWQSKKELDYKDWKTILNLRNLGLHYTDEGIKVLNNILNTMNNNRLTTSKSTTPLEIASQAVLDNDIKKLIQAHPTLK